LSNGLSKPDTTQDHWPECLKYTYIKLAIYGTWNFVEKSLNTATGTLWLTLSSPHNTFMHTYERTYLITKKTMPWLKQLVANLWTRRTRFNPRSAHVALVMDKVALGPVFPPSTMVFPPVAAFHQYSMFIHSSTPDTILSQQLTVPLNNMLQKHTHCHKHWYGEVQCFLFYVKKII
jgi:hypothetical protein